MMPDDSMVPVTADLVARLRAYRLYEAEARITTLERELAEARKEHHKDFVLLKETAATVMSLTQRERDTSQALAASQAEVERLRGLVETAFRDGLSYGTDVVVKDPNEAWRTSRVRAALNPGGVE